MARLPIPDQDNGVWGAILNSFLNVEHTADGSLRIRTDGTLAGLYRKPSDGIPLTDLDSNVQAQLAQGVSAYQRTTGGTSAGGVQIDMDGSDIASLGVRGAGSTGKAADAGHVHPMPRLDQVGSPTASVSLNSQKVTNLANGTAASDAVTVGQLPTAGTGSSNYAAGNDSRIVGAVQTVNGIAPVNGVLTLTPDNISSTIAVVARYSNGIYPLRSSVTSDANQTVIWLGPTAPPIGSGYASNGVDIWDQTVS